MNSINVTELTVAMWITDHGCHFNQWIESFLFKGHIVLVLILHRGPNEFFSASVINFIALAASFCLWVFLWMNKTLSRYFLGSNSLHFSLLNIRWKLFLKLGSMSDNSNWVKIQVKTNSSISWKQDTKQNTFRLQIQQDLQDCQKMRWKVI